MRMNNHLTNPATDILSVTAIVAITQVAQSIAAVLGVIYILLKLYEMETVQKWLRSKKRNADQDDAGQ